MKKRGIKAKTIQGKESYNIILFRKDTRIQFETRNTKNGMAQDGQGHWKRRNVGC